MSDAHLAALQILEDGGSYPAFNLGSGRGYSVKDVVEAVRGVTGQDLAATVGPRRPGDPPVLVADASLGKRELDWEPRFTEIEKIVESAWRWTNRCGKPSK